MSAPQPQARFSSASTQPTPLTVVDSTTGLEWLVKPLPRATHQQQLDTIAALDAAGHTDWRLPNRTELQTLVERLESGELSLEDSLGAFEQGIRLTRDCQASLAQAEQKVQQLLERDGELQEVPFDTDDQA